MAAAKNGGNNGGQMACHISNVSVMKSVSGEMVMALA
jgi:hypothetical protein